MKFIIKSVLLLISLHVLVFVAFTARAEVIKEKYINEDGLKCTIRNTTPSFEYHYISKKEIRKIASKHMPRAGRARGDLKYSHDAFSIVYKSGKTVIYIATESSPEKQAEDKEHEEKHATCGNFHPEIDSR